MKNPALCRIADCDEDRVPGTDFCLSHQHANVRALPNGLYLAVIEPAWRRWTREHNASKDMTGRMAA